MSNGLFFRDLIVYAVLVLFVIFYTKQNNLWGTKKGTTKTKVDVKKAKDYSKRRNFLLKTLKFCDKIGRTFGFEPSIAIVEKTQFRIERCHISLPYIERNITAMELIGFFKIIKFISAFIAILGYILLDNPMILLLFILLFIDKAFDMIADVKISEEDDLIERDFPDLYMLLYSRLIRGTQVRLAPTLDEYIKSLDAIEGENSNKAMRSFVTELRKNIEIYGDDSMAVHKMRDMYRSAMLVNFFNLAIQSLRGVDNRDKLLAFRIELSQKKLDYMTAKAQKMVEKGQRAVMLIFIILGEFIVLSWAAKAGLAFLPI